MQCLNSETWVKAWRWLGESSSSGSSKAIAGSGTRTQQVSHATRMGQQAAQATLVFASAYVRTSAGNEADRDAHE